MDFRKIEQELDKQRQPYTPLEYLEQQCWQQANLGMSQLALVYREMLRQSATGPSPLTDKQERLIGLLNDAENAMSAGILKLQAVMVRLAEERGELEPGMNFEMQTRVVDTQTREELQARHVTINEDGTLHVPEGN